MFVTARPPLKPALGSKRSTFARVSCLRATDADRLPPPAQLVVHGGPRATPAPMALVSSARAALLGATAASAVALALLAGSARADVQGFHALSASEVAESGLVALRVDETPSGRSGFCSGTLIGDRAVLLAEHCFHTPRGPVAWAVFGTDAFDPAAKKVAIVSTESPGTADLAVAELAEDAPAEVRRMPVRTELERPLSRVPVRMLGYGRRSPDDLASAGYAHSLEGVASNVEPRAPLFSVRPVGAAPCAGHSGGPALALGAQGSEVIGVLSKGDPECRAGDDFTPTPTHGVWLEGVLEDLSDRLR